MKGRLPAVTLLEVLVTLAVASLLLALATWLITLAGRAQNTAAASEARAEVVAFRHNLRRLFFTADPAGAADIPFEGTSDSLSFTSLSGLDALPNATAQRVFLTLEANTLTLRQTAITSDGTELATRMSSAAFTGALTLAYLATCSGGGAWVASWNDDVPPLAIRLTSDEAAFWPGYTAFRPIWEGDTCEPD